MEQAPNLVAIDRNRPDPLIADIEAALERMISSRTFRSATGQMGMLKYVVEQTIQGRGDLIKEYCIGTEVFRRGDSFDPRRDNIVRAEARKLRLRLAKYYASEGSNDPLRIEFPKGQYVPVFARRSASAEQALAERQVLPPGPAIVNISVPIPAAEPSDPTGRTSLAWFPRKWTIYAALFAGLLIAGMAVSILQPWKAPSSELDRPSILVLPFLNLDDDKKDEYFSDGLTDELIDSLGRVPGLHVVSRTSAFQFKGKIPDARQIGKTLHVRTVLNGSVRNYGGTLRITANLDDTSNGYRIWSHSYERPWSDALSIQREISQAIVNAMGPQFVGNGPGRIFQEPVQARPVITEAYQAYLKGRYFLEKHDPKALPQAIEYFEEAISSDKEYAPAYVGLALCYAANVAINNALPRDMSPKIQAAALKALKLDSALGAAHIELAIPLSYANNWPAAEREFRTGLELSPGDAVGHWTFSIFLSRVGRLEEALSEAKVALDLDPVSSMRTQTVARILYWSRRYDDAIDEYEKALSLDQNLAIARLGLGLAHLQKKNFARGIAETEVARALRGDDPFVLGQLGYGYALSGNPTKAREMLRLLLSNVKQGTSPAFAIAEIYIGLQEKEEAYRWLETAINEEGGEHLSLKADPLYDSLRSDARFAGLLRKMKLL